VNIFNALFAGVFAAETEFEMGGTRRGIEILPGLIVFLVLAAILIGPLADLAAIEFRERGGDSLVGDSVDGGLQGIALKRSSSRERADQSAAESPNFRWNAARTWWRRLPRRA
jgi:hypothetical protein